MRRSGCTETLHPDCEAPPSPCLGCAQHLVFLLETMAESSNPLPANGSTLVLGVVVGAIAGASGLAWWFFREAERRRQFQGLLQRTSRQELALKSASATPFADPRDNQAVHRPQQDSPFQDRVQQLNQAIDEVRRQLEQLQTQGDRPGR